MRIYLADDHPMFVAGISRVIERDPELELVGHAEDGRTAISAILKLEPDVAILDFAMPESNGLQVLAALHELGIKTRVIILTGTDSRNLQRAAIREGAVGYLLKTVHWDDLIDTIKRVGRGERVISSNFSDLLISAQDALTPREREVLECLARDLSTKQIAKELSIELSTVRFHLSRIYKRLGVSSMKAAVIEAMRRGIIR